jgi:hypothetical protein
MKYLVIFLTLLSQIAEAHTYDLGRGIQLNLSGYLGYKHIFSKVYYDETVPSSPETGLLANLKLTDRLTIFNQFKYGKNIDDILVYNQIAYDLDTHFIPLNDLNVVFKAGKIQHDTTLYNTTRVNPRTRQGVFQPQAIYFSTLEQGATSGVGLGVDVKYKRLKISYVIDKTTVVNPDSEIKAWTRNNDLTNLSTKFGDSQVVSMTLDLPEHGLKLKTAYAVNKFYFTSMSYPQLGKLNFAGEQAAAGIEWTHDKFKASFEGLCGKPRPDLWSNKDSLSCGTSYTTEYDINQNFTVRTNYNQFKSQRPAYLSPADRIQVDSKDLTLGLNWHQGNWGANLEGHWIRGGRNVDATEFVNNPTDYKEFFVVATNLVYFFN